MSERRIVEPPAGTFRARVRVPGDKSMSHRALILAAMAEGESRLIDLAPGADVAATRAAVRELGVQVEDEKVVSPGCAGWLDPPEGLDAANSGTTMRLMAGALAGHGRTVVIDGDESLARRPMERVAAPLRSLGAFIETTDGFAPISVGGRSGLHGSAVELDLPSAQVRTAVELAGLRADGQTTVDSPPGFRDHTERWLEAFGLGEWLSDTAFRVRTGAVPTGEYRLPGDASSAAFLWAAAALRAGSEITAERVTLNRGRTGFLDVLQGMGAMVEIDASGDVYGDPVGTVTVAGAPMGGVRVEGTESVRTIDELGLVAVLATQATGETVIADAEELRVKESDRVAAVVEVIRALGGVAEETPDGLMVTGRGPLSGGTVDPHGDHRIAMTAAVAAAAAEGPVHILDAEVVDVSWPGFFETLEAIWSSP